MNIRTAVPTLVAGMAGLLAVAGLITFAIRDAPDYADLVPAPDSIVWHEGQDTTFFVSTNRENVDMRINSVALGIANVQGAVPHSGELMVLGASVGCQEWAVSKLFADAISTGGFTLKGNIDRDNFVGTAQVHFRTRVQGTTDWDPGVGSPIDVPNNSFDLHLSVSNDVWEIEASSDDSFPTALTRLITVDTSAGTSTVDEEAETLLMLPDTGVGLRGCSVHQDVRVTLNGEDGEELNSYTFDIGAELTPTPSPNAGYKERRVCVDDASSRAVYLDGGENVGAVFAASDFGLSTLDSVTIGDVPDSAGNRYFFEISSSYQVTVSKAGAGNTQGLDADDVYPIRLTATDDDGQTRYLDVGVWLDTSTLSPNDDGRCS